MKNSAVLAVCSLFVVFELVGIVHAADDTFIEQFFGSPLFILAAVAIIVALASLYHRIRK
jgi:hypothetical protein